VIRTAVFQNKRTDPISKSLLLSHFMFTIIILSGLSGVSLSSYFWAISCVFVLEMILVRLRVSVALLSFMIFLSCFVKMASVGVRCRASYRGAVPMSRLGGVVLCFWYVVCSFVLVFHSAFLPGRSVCLPLTVSSFVKIKNGVNIMPSPICSFAGWCLSVRTSAGDFWQEFNHEK
jgi:hypothetical protein